MTPPLQLVKSFYFISEYGAGYAWFPSALDIAVGDTVVWTWNSQPLITGIGYRVFSVSGPGNLTYDGNAFNSGPRVSSGLYAVYPLL